MPIYSIQKLQSKDSKRQKNTDLSNILIAINYEKQTVVNVKIDVENSIKLFLQLVNGENDIVDVAKSGGLQKTRVKAIYFQNNMILKVFFPYN